MAPRISMILGIDTLGSVYLSLVQANSNSKIMEIFIIQLVQMLDFERPGWRKNTVWVWDNAVCRESLKFLIIFSSVAISCVAFHAESLGGTESPYYPLRTA